MSWCIGDDGTDYIDPGDYSARARSCNRRLSSSTLGGSFIVPDWVESRGDRPRTCTTKPSCHFQRVDIMGPGRILHDARAQWDPGLSAPVPSL